MEARHFVKQYETFYYARLADAVGRSLEALDLICAHVTQGFRKDAEGQLVRVVGTSYDEAVLFDGEEIESFVEIVKNYASGEKSAVKKLIAAE